MFFETVKMLLAVAFGGAVALFAAGAPSAAGEVSEIAVRAEALAMNPEDAAADRVGRLRFMGGLVLRSDERRFGGWSALAWEGRCGRLLAVSDTGNWMAFEPVEGKGRLTGVGRAWLAPVLGADGAPPPTKEAGDAEAVSLSGGEADVAFEQTHRIQRYDGIDACAPETLAARARAVEAIPASGAWPRNGGAEAFTRLGDGRMLALSEEAAGPDGGRDALIWRDGKVERRFSWLPPSGFDPTDMVMVGTKALVLHRKFSPLTGAAAAIAVADIAGQLDGSATETLVRPEVLATIAPPLSVDNMEGMALRREGGRMFLYLMSDDNFRSVQRTLLLKFELVGE